MTTLAGIAVRTRAGLLALALLAALAHPALAQSQATVEAVQNFLNQQGYSAGPEDGLMGAKTRQAIEAFQADNGMAVTGEIDEALLKALETTPRIEVETLDETGTPTEAPLAGTGDVAFRETGDGTLVITDGFPYRTETLPPQEIVIAEAGDAALTAAADSEVPLLYQGSVVQAPGASFVPLFLAFDPAEAAQSSMADAIGITWRFPEAGAALLFDGYRLTSTEPGATIAFTEDGVVATGFALEAR